MISKNFLSIHEIIQSFPTEESCLHHLESLRWRGVVESPFDPLSKVYRCSHGNFRCRNTGKYFNAKTGTLFYNSRIPLQKWFIAMWLVTIEQPGITSIELAAKLQLTQKSAWYMLKRLKSNFKIEPVKKYKSRSTERQSSLETAENVNVIVEDDKFKMSQWLTLLKKPV